MTDQTPATPVAEQSTALIKTALAQVDLGKIKFIDVLKAAMGSNATVAASGTPGPPAPLAITDVERAALKRLPEVYGKVAPTEARALSVQEQRDLVEEREVVDTLLRLLKGRKDESIRETIAFHLDALTDLAVESGEVEPPERDEKGHYLLKQEVPVDGTTKKLQRTVSNPAPTMPSAADLLAAQERGEITRAQYLSLTSVPDVPRVFDEAKARKAIGKDPALMLVLARLAKPGKKTGTIKVEKA